MTTPLEALFEPGLLDRLQGQCDMAGAAIDVRLIAADVADMVRRKAGTTQAVRNPSGMLVARVRKLLNEQSDARSGARLESQHRYAAFVAGLFREIALEQLGRERQARAAQCRALSVHCVADLAQVRGPVHRQGPAALVEGRPAGIHFLHAGDLVGRPRLEVSAHRAEHLARTSRRRDQANEPIRSGARSERGLGCAHGLWSIQLQSRGARCHCLQGARHRKQRKYLLEFCAP